MASSANLRPAVGNGVGVEPGELSPEDAERFASAFRPMWEFDDAPFAAAPAKLSDSDILELSAGGINADVAVALTAPLVAKPPPPVARPATPATRQMRPNPDSLGMHSQRRAAAAVAQRPAARDITGDMVVPGTTKSNLTLFIGVGVVVAALALFFGIRAATSSSEESVPATKQSAAPTTPKEEPQIPPPPPAANPPVATTTVAAAHAPEAPRPEKPLAVQVSRPEPPSTTPLAPRPPPARVEHPPARPVAPPAPAPAKKPGGGIVRDNPF